MEIHSAIVFQRKLSKDDRFSTSILVVALSFKQQLPDILTGSLFFARFHFHGLSQVVAVEYIPWFPHI